MSSTGWFVYWGVSSLAMICFVMAAQQTTRLGERSVHGSSKGLSLLCILSVFVLGAYFIGLRPINLGSDTPNYVRAYRALGSLTGAREVGLAYFGNTEWLYWPVQAVVKLLVPEPSAWLLTTYALTFFGAWLAYRFMAQELGAPAIIFILLFFTYELVFFGNILRQVASYPLGILACYQLSERRRFRASALFAIAVGLHWSSLIFVLYPVLRILPITTRVRAVIYFAGALAASGLILALTQRIGGASAALGSMASLSEKAASYSGGTTGFGPVYTTFNFFGCVVMILMYLLALDDVRRSPVFNAVFLLFSGLVVVGVAVPTLSERFITNTLYLFPAIAWVVVRRLIPRSEGLRRIALAVFFLTMGAAVLMQKSAIYTLGLVSD
ncbi:EpsG family protein [Dyella sp. C11]|uniref:EpsG family protein n=1 Tax=Dyella sp. C11 TaxID=2126991 RepID=UPI00130043C6|nr:EpsG family protein [Dyella sp. C11]